ncbi:MAG: hypothetical protein M1819_005259 [Sarea resinae]|nr:MAG: hypothetical protein M1819_005259 [Sarea resinae]
MPGLVRKILVVAAVDGLVLQPLAQKNQRAGPGVKIDYKTNGIAPVLDSPKNPSLVAASFEAHGIIGLLRVPSASFLISISGRQQIAQIRGRPIYVITDVALIPLSSQAEATTAITQTRDVLKKRLAVKVSENGDSDASDEEPDGSVFTDDDLQDDNSSLSSAPATGDDPKSISDGPAHKRRTSIAEDVIGKKGQYGIFAERWFSRRGWSVEKRRMQGMSSEDLTAEQPDEPPAKTEAGGSPKPAPELPAVNGGIANESKGAQPSEEAESKESTSSDVTSTLLPKLLRTTRILLTSRSFFFSYDYDITRSLATQGTQASDLPLYQKVDPLFFWNRHLISPFIEGGHQSLVLPLMQGFVGQRTFIVDQPAGSHDKSMIEEAGDSAQVPTDVSKEAPTTSEDSKRSFLLTLISRRSVKRAGLRYLRRGIDEEGYTANSVETEQILSSPSWPPSEKVYSFLQFRGSIPLFFSQSPYSFKPVPLLQRSPETNQAAFKEHFANLKARYGHIQIVSLLEKHGNEARIGQEYERNIDMFNEGSGVDSEKITAEYFDFHSACRGMKFENVSLLTDSLSERLSAFGKTVLLDDKVIDKQTGVVRTNCMDCLDRTNVVQSACGRVALQAQLKDEGISLDLQTFLTQWFDTLWADNGDAISKQYSSTAALKGDFTRTRKRDYRGALNDFGLTLSRYFNNIVNDYFSQAAIDYLLGNVTDQVFEEFEAEMMSGDPAMSMLKVRQNAIDTSAKIVIADQSEKLLGSWTVLCPHEQNSSLRSLPFEECVLLLTDAALYAVRFDWTTEKVSSFERVNLRHILGLKWGAYITSTLTSAQSDEKRNVGFIVCYKPGKEDVQRVNTRSLKSSPMVDDGPDTDTPDLQPTSTSEPYSPIATRILAFKALPTSSATSPFSSSSRNAPKTNASALSRRPNERDLIRAICAEIEHAALGGEILSPKKHTEDLTSTQPAKGDESIESSDMKPASESLFVKEEDVLSLAAAKKQTGLLEQWGYELKRLVWA